MQKTTKILLIMFFGLFVVVIFIINIIIKRYEMESTPTLSKSDIEIPRDNQKEPKTIEERIEQEPALSSTEPLLN